MLCQIGEPPSLSNLCIVLCFWHQCCLLLVLRSQKQPVHKMPTVAVDRDELFERLGRTYTEEEFDELCFQFGVELDEVMTEAEASAARGLSESATGGAISGAGRVLYYIAIPANRTDLLCIEGIARALNVFLGRIPDPHYAIDNSAAPGGSIIEMVVKPSTQVRHFFSSSTL